MKYFKIASYAVYSELYEKKIIQKPLDIIILCIKELLKQSSIQVDFDSVKVQEELKEKYSFDDIPLLVVDRALSILEIDGIVEKNKETKSYRVIEWIDDKDNINEFFDNEQKDMQNLLIKLKEHIDNKFSTRYDYSDIEKALCNILLSDKVDVADNLEKSLLAFLNKNKDDVIEKIVKSLRIGYLLFSGLTIDLLGNDKITKDLYLFLDQEILFYLMGYDSEITKIWVKDLIDLIKKIDIDKKVKLRYFERTKNDIEGYFREARLIKEKHRIVDQSKRPMVKIFNDTNSGKDVSELQGEFFGLLEKKYGICLYDESSDSIDGQYIVMDEHFDSDEWFDDIDRNNITNFINRINFIRKGKKSTKLVDSKAIFITNTSKFAKVSKNICDSSDTQYVFLLNQFTNLLWNICKYKFSSYNIPSNIDTLNYLKQTFRNIISQDLSKAFDKTTKAYKNNEIDEKVLEKKLIAINEYQKKAQKDQYEDNDIDELEKIDAEAIYSKAEELSYANINYRNEIKEHTKTKEELDKLKNDKMELLKQNEEKDKLSEELRLELEKEKAKNKILEEKKFKNRVKKLVAYIVDFIKIYKKYKKYIILGIVVFLIILSFVLKPDFETIIGWFLSIVHL